MAKYNKAITALVIALVGVLATFGVVPLGIAETLGSEETVQAVVASVFAVLAALGVWKVPNNPE